MNRWFLFSAAAVIAIGVTGCVDRQTQQEAKATEKLVTNPVKAVVVQDPRVEAVSQTVEITGDVTANDDATIGSKQNNRVTAVFVKDGDKVTQGQLLATLDDTGAMALLKQAQAQVLTALAAISNARSQLAQADQNLAVGPHRSTVQVLLAKAQVSGSQRSLDKVVNGVRPEEMRQAQANLDSAKANLEYQKKQYERTKTLVDEGALAGQSLDQQKAAYDQATDQVKSAQEALDIDVNGSRPEDIGAAKAQLQQAVQTLKNAEDQKKLDPLLKDQVDAAQAQVESAKAQLDSARAQIQIADQAVADTKVYAPFSGRVSGRPIQAGSVAGASSAILRIVSSEGVYFSAQLPSTNIDKVHLGMPVSIRIDGVSNKTYAGQVVGVNPLADAIGRLFSVRVQITGPTDGLKAGMFARGTVAIRTVPDAIVVPTAAIVTRGDKKYLYVVDGGKAHQVKVTLGLSKDDDTQVIGLPAGAKVVVQGQEDLFEGAQVNVKAATTALKDGSGAGEG